MRPTSPSPQTPSYKCLSPLTRPDSHVHQVEAEDMDIGPNAELAYTITGGNPHGLFRISPTDGEITLAKEITPGHKGLHRLVVMVSDKGKPQKQTTALVHIYVNETIGNITLLESLVGHSLYTPLDTDIAGEPDQSLASQHSNVLYGSLAGITGVIFIIIVVVVVRHHLQQEGKSGYQAGKKESKDPYTPKQAPKHKRGRKGKKGGANKQATPLEEDEEEVSVSPRIHLPLNYPPSSPDLGRHYRSNSPLPSIQLQPQSPCTSASTKHQAVQDLPATNTFVGTGDENSISSDQYSDQSYKPNPLKYGSRQLPHRRVTFSTANQTPDLQDPAHSLYDSGLEESETPSSKSSSGPRIGPLAVPEEHYERTTPDGSIGEIQHPESDVRSLPDVTMTGNCTPECTELGHSDSCWMPGQSSPTRKTKSAPKLSTFVPYQERRGSEQLANGRPESEEEQCTGPLASHSAFSKDTPPHHTSKREIYL
ncbi:hypothetical protein SKAU_G00422360 [Synaphobranchus kaupii]|uniref:Cadherin domain-containing protein n=1 Tax=Synaphobranchus kaupii TaxID=118154 RepID=A0A9Q1E720_SYNKA|nr:hypothetical protein SKAU_G00422360 [Synaphobranchus kaupii]